MIPFWNWRNELQHFCNRQRPCKMQHRLPVSPLRVPLTLFGAHRRRGGVKSPNITHLPLTYVGRNKVENAKAHAYSVCCILAKLPVGNASFCCIRALSSLAIIAKSSRARLASSIRCFKLLSLLASVVPTKISSGPSTFCKGAVRHSLVSDAVNKVEKVTIFWPLLEVWFINLYFPSMDVSRNVPIHFQSSLDPRSSGSKRLHTAVSTSALKYQEFALLR